MTPEELNLAIMGVEYLVKEYPVVSAEIKTLMSKPNPTPEDWTALRNRVMAATYASLVPNAALNTPTE
jgi:hypothetical protein